MPRILAASAATTIRTRNLACTLGNAFPGFRNSFLFHTASFDLTALTSIPLPSENIFS
jgi:hypothetical protein